jgi:hypothetical protein
MDSASEELKTALDAAVRQVTNGWLSFLCVKSLHEAYEDQKVYCARFFFLGAYWACLNRSAEWLTGLLAKNGDRKGIHYLLEAAAQEGIAPAGQPQQVEAWAQEAAGARAALRDSEAGLNLAQSADLDEAGLAPAETLQALERCYRGVIELVNRYAGFFGNPAPVANELEEDVVDDVTFLMQLMAGDCV